MKDCIRERKSKSPRKGLTFVDLGIKVPFKRLMLTVTDRQTRVIEPQALSFMTVKLVVVSRSFSCYRQEIRVVAFKPFRLCRVKSDDDDLPGSVSDREDHAFLPP